MDRSSPLPQGPGLPPSAETFPLVRAGTALGRLWRVEEAVSAFERVVAAAPGDPDLLALLGWALSRSGRNEEALRAYDRALTLAPDHAWIPRGKISALFRLGRSEEGLEFADEALRRTGNHLALRNVKVLHHSRHSQPIL